MTIKDQVNELFEQQLSVWEMARNNFEGLKTVQIREFDFDGFGVKCSLIQHVWCRRAQR